MLTNKRMFIAYFIAPVPCVKYFFPPFIYLARYFQKKLSGFPHTFDP